MKEGVHLVAVIYRDFVNANVVCKQLGYTRPYSYAYWPFCGQDNGSIWMDEVVCSLRDSHLNSCSFSCWVIRYCSHMDDVGVTCGKAINKSNSLVCKKTI